MEDNVKIRKIKTLINQNKLAVLSTVTSENTSESAVVELSARENLELIFDTLSTFRKYENLKSNQNVSVVVGWEPATVQYEGITVELSDSELEEYKQVHFAKFPEAVKFEKLGIKFFKIIPKWIRYTDVSRQPWEVLEINFPAG
ncbi:MAG: putative stress protein (general stress protein 26) [Parcubacteria group bacterium Gr01-1014_31]|nr:MAG: putative stress protein (general stress protein 26) [Parcubacteria group bacterium Gr01-1014_31]